MQRRTKAAHGQGAGAADAERSEIWSPPGLPGLHLMRARFISRSFPRHSHEGFGVGVIEQGALGFTYRGEHLVAPAGRINTVNPDEPHTGQAADTGGWTYRMFYCSADFLARLAEDIDDRPRPLPFFTAGVIDDPALARLVQRAHAALMPGMSGPGCRLEGESLLQDMFGGLLARHSHSPARPPRPGREHAAVARAMEYLRASYDQNPGLADLARAAHLSPHHLLRVFAAQTGLTPHAWLMQLRAREARKLLAEGLAPAEAAARTGFTDQSHLTRVFKRLTGVTPGQFRNSVQGGRAAVR